MLTISLTKLRAHFKIRGHFDSLLLKKKKKHLFIIVLLKSTDQITSQSYEWRGW